MKWWLYIFAVYFISLSFLPCSDKTDCNPGKSQLTKPMSHEDHDNHTENCPPFCSCACCSSSLIVQFKYIELTQFISFVKQSYPELYFNFPYLNLPIWQPPQLS